MKVVTSVFILALMYICQPSVAWFSSDVRDADDDERLKLDGDSDIDDDVDAVEECTWDKSLAVEELLATNTAKTLLTS
ncbi:unnamed protein product [Phytophthora fragariaefolia]|uniref:Unnamed protein product n=1 Tax=Phytophthora fragariaefolia TaxID=1490495 RepID=A0A9W6YL46_9STRA|nr:unnamed protein product [Phytophthora fragariaefolia]